MNKRKLKISKQDIDNLYGPNKKENMNNNTEKPDPKNYGWHNQQSFEAYNQKKSEKNMNENTEKMAPASVEPQTQETPKYIEVSIFGSKLEPVSGKVYLGQYLGMEEIEQVNENGEISYFESCNFAVETETETGMKRYDKKFVSTVTFLNAAKRGALIPEQWYKLEYKGEGQNGNKRYHIWDIVHIKRIN